MAATDTHLTIFQHLAILTTITALLSYINHRFIKMPTAIGLMVLTMAGAVVLIVLKAVGVDIEAHVHPFVTSIDFEAVLMDSMLGFLLFAGALHVNIDSLLDRKRRRHNSIQLHWFMDSRKGAKPPRRKRA